MTIAGNDAPSSGGHLVGSSVDRSVAATASLLESHGWTPLVTGPQPGQERGLADYVLLGPGGVFVIRLDDEVVGGSPRSRSRLAAEGIDRNAQHVATLVSAIAALVRPSIRTAVYGVVCRAARDQRPVLRDGVLVVSHHDLLAYLSAQPARLTPYDVADVGRLLSADAKTDEPALLTTAEVLAELAALPSVPDPVLERNTPMAAMSQSTPVASARAASPARRDSRVSGLRSDRRVRRASAWAGLALSAVLALTFHEQLASLMTAILIDG